MSDDDLQIRALVRAMQGRWLTCETCGFEGWSSRLIWCRKRAPDDHWTPVFGPGYERHCVWCDARMQQLARAARAELAQDRRKRLQGNVPTTKR